MTTQNTTAKFNKSEIFRNAWSLVKTAGKSLSEALKAAWAKAKNTTKAIAYILKNGSTINIPSIGASSKGVEFDIIQKVWEGGDKKRVYIKTRFSDGSGADCGFVDLATGKMFLKSSPVWIANNIANSIF